MNRPSTAVVIILAALFPLDSSAHTAARKQVNRLVIDSKTPRMCWLDKPIAHTTSGPTDDEILNRTKPCPPELLWNPESDFFHTGEVVKVIIIRRRFFSTFSATVNGTPVAEEQFPIRNLPGAVETPTPAAATKAVPEGDPTKETDLKKEIEKLKSMLNLLSPADVVIVKQLSKISAQTYTLEENTRNEADGLGPTTPYVNIQEFQTFVEATDRIVGDFADLSPRLADRRVTAYLAEAETAQKWLNSKNLHCSFAGAGTTLKELCSYIIFYSPDDLRATLMAIFNHINNLWRRSEDAPYEIALGQWSRSTLVDFQINETDHFQPYDSSKVFKSGSGGPDQPAPIAAEAESGATDVVLPKKSDGTPAKQPGTPSKPSATVPRTAAATPPNGPTPDGTFYFRGHFDVHSFYFANVVSGFFMSTLRNREYGGQMLTTTTNGSSTFINVPFVGPAHRPQYHYYVGIDFYLKRRDFFPGFRNSVTPSMLFGYGVDDPFNFLIGPNFETKIGLNFGFGFHSGREQFLAPGLVPGPNGTHLSDPTKAPPTVNRFRGGAYGNLGFDLSIFKSIFGALAGLK
jgi:hypothetical protein